MTAGYNFRLGRGTPMRNQLVAILCTAVLVTAATVAHAQSARAFAVRLAPMPVDGPPMMATIAGLGAATATLTGSTLTIDGSFQGLKSPATQLKLFRGVRGIRGTAVRDLPAPQSATAGTFKTTVELTPSQLDDLNRGRLYLQLFSEKAPEGNLWGWLLPQDKPRDNAKEIR